MGPVYALSMLLFDSKKHKVIGQSPKTNCIVAFQAYDKTRLHKNVFAKSFFESRVVPSIHVIPKDGNYWYHDIELLQYLEQLTRQKHNLMFYGASMGGYGAFHYAQMLNASCLSISPQLRIFGAVRESDKRWADDWESIEPAFNEEDNLVVSSKNIWIFADTKFHLEKLHLQQVQNLGDQLIAVDWTMHTAIRCLTKVEAFKRLFLEFHSTGEIKPTAGDYTKIFELDVQTKLNGIRNGQGSFRHQWAQVAMNKAILNHDHVSLFMLAELFADHDSPADALICSRVGFILNPVPYMKQKHMAISEKIEATNLDAEIQWIQTVETSLLKD